MCEGVTKPVIDAFKLISHGAFPTVRRCFQLLSPRVSRCILIGVTRFLFDIDLLNEFGAVMVGEGEGSNTRGDRASRHGEGFIVRRKCKGSCRGVAGERSERRLDHIRNYN